MSWKTMIGGAIFTIYVVFIGDLANWWWNWPEKPDWYPKEFFLHLLIVSLLVCIPLFLPGIPIFFTWVGTN